MVLTRENRKHNTTFSLNTKETEKRALANRAIYTLVMLEGVFDKLEV